MRVTIPALAAVLTALASSPMAAQRRDLIELGAFARYTHFDPSLTFDDALGAGGYLDLFFSRRLAIEGSIATLSTKGTAPGDVSLLPIHVGLLYVAPTTSRAAPLVGIGYAHQQYRKSFSAWEDGVSGMLGLRVALGRMVAGRVAGVADYFPSPLNEGAGVSDNWDFSLQAGLGLRLGVGGGSGGGGSGGVKDSDHDGVPNAADACPQTPRGITVDGRGCPPPRDTDADGVADPDDRCPATPAGDRVDAAGCSLPKDADGDGVADANDRCPGTPAGTTVDAAGCPLDSDADGVLDTADKCPNTAAGEAVDAVGCPRPKDSDHDGVLDPADRCPGTPAGQRVDAAGCAILFSGVQRTLVLEGVNFDAGSANLTDQSHNTLDRVAAALIGNPNVRVEVGGYTDSRGGAAANLRLSQARAAAVRTYLISQGVPATQLTSRGFGAAGPIASNTTAVGRARNRRVELHRMN
jgi:outer membrane protein OmpA-like peptidoglycan-associated protein